MSTSYTPGSGSDGRKDPVPGANERRDQPDHGDGRPAAEEDPPTRVNDPVQREERSSFGAERKGHRLDPDGDRDRDLDGDRDRARHGAVAGNGAGAAVDRESNIAREKEAYGGIKVGSAFFGWLTATGSVVLLTALVAAIAAAVGLSMNVDPNEAAQNPQALQITGVVLLAVVLFIAYFAGGYVAGRMARFDGAKQGVAVWLWAVVVAIIVAVISALAGSQFNILANTNSFPRLPINEGALTTVGIIALVAAAVVTLIGAVLGGMTGMRYHRKVDRAGFDLENEPRARR